jgi:hypothetical protein
MALSIIPSTQYIKLENDTDYWTDVAGLGIGDNISIKGSKYNDGVYTITGFTQHSSGHYMTVAGRVITDEVAFTLDTDYAYSNTVTINIVDSPDVRVGQTVTGTGVASETTVAAVAAGTEGIDASQITLSDATTGGIVGSGETLTFTSSPDGAASGIVIKGRKTTGDKLVALADAENNVVDIWSYNDADDSGTSNNAWIASEINPVLISPSSEHVASSEFVFTFVDEILRVSDSNAQNNAIMKWYGYIQRSQFDNTRGLSFSGWYEHPTYLIQPSSGIDIPTGSQHTIGTDAHYTALNSLMADTSSSTSPVRISEEITAITEDYIPFEITSNELQANHHFEVGQVYSILSTSAEEPECFMIRRPSEGLSGTVAKVRVYRGYGNTKDILIADTAGAIYKRGIGWNIGVTSHADDGEWETKTYEFWQTFIYDGNQETLPSKFDNSLVVTDDLKALECTVYADRFYHGRISGGRIYTREKDGDDDLILFADIDIVQGARMSLDSDYTAWTYRADTPETNTQNSGYWSALSSSVGLKSIRPSLDTYRNLNGYSHEKKYNSLGKSKETYQASIIAGRRTFIANVVLKEPDDTKKRYGDRIMYSEINKFDTFLPLNFIDVSKGDFGEYTALEVFADRLIAFKHNLVHIINISNPSPTNWFLEETVQKVGVSYQHSVTKTDFGVAWANEAGCFLYDGRSVRNLIENKLAVFDSSAAAISIPTWNDFAQGSTHDKDTMIGYDTISNQLIIMRSPKDLSANSNRCFIYDFDSKGWTYNTNLFTDSYYYTNFAIDWHNNLIVGTEASSTTIAIKKYLPNAVANGSQVLTTRDIDFGQPGLKKKIYKVIVTYRSSVEQQLPLEYAVDGTLDFNDFASGSNISPQGDSGGAGYLESTPSSGREWDIATFITDSISDTTCQSIQFQFNPPSSGTFEINDITIEYRILRQSDVS